MTQQKSVQCFKNNIVNQVKYIFCDTVTSLYSQSMATDVYYYYYQNNSYTIYPKQQYHENQVTKQSKNRKQISNERNKKPIAKTCKLDKTKAQDNAGHKTLQNEEIITVCCWKGLYPCE